MSAQIMTQVETVTPELAAHWLQRNQHNVRKNPSRSRIEELARAIRSGNWVLTHQGLAFDEAGNLLDGQHRLAAIVLAGIPVLINVTRGLPMESSRAMDLGWTRALQIVCSADGSVVQACAFLARLHHVNHVQPYHVDAIASSPVGGAILRLREVCNTRAKKRAVAPVLTAAALRWFQGSAYVEQQWRAFVLLDYDTMSPLIKAFCKQVTDNQYGSNELAARAWMAFDPTRRDLTKIQLSDQAGQLAEMRSHYLPSWRAGEVDGQ